VLNRYRWNDNEDSSKCGGVARSRRHLELFHWRWVGDWQQSDSMGLW